MSEEEPPHVLPSRIQTERRRRGVKFFFFFCAHECKGGPVVYQFRYTLMRINCLIVWE